MNWQKNKKPWSKGQQKSEMGLAKEVSAQPIKKEKSFGF